MACVEGYHGEIELCVDEKVHFEQRFLVLRARQADKLSVFQHAERGENSVNRRQQYIAVVVIGIVVARVAMHICVILL